MTAMQFVNLIQTAERAGWANPSSDPRFVPGHGSARAVGARWLRAHASVSLRLARRIDPRRSDDQHLAA